MPAMLKTVTVRLPLQLPTSELDVTPSEHSSGDKRRQGSITKTGNSYARKLLVEVAWSYRHPGTRHA
jgi:transposase